MCQGQSAPKPYAAFPPHIKFDQDWPTGFRDIQVQKRKIFVTQGQVTPKWVVWFSPKLNLTGLLCLSSLPATLMMIRSKMNKLAWRHHFPIWVYGKFFKMLRPKIKFYLFATAYLPILFLPTQLFFFAFPELFFFSFFFFFFCYKSVSFWLKY